MLESSALQQLRASHLEDTPWARINGLTKFAAGTTPFARRNFLTPTVPSLMRLIIGLFAVRRSSLPLIWRKGMRKGHGCWIFFTPT